MLYEIIKKDKSICYFCLEDIDYYIKFNCNCHNYLHTKCLENVFFTNSFICKKKISNEKISDKNFIYFNNLMITNFVIEKLNIKYYLEKIQNKTLENKTHLMLILFFIFSILFTFIIVIPCLSFDYILEKIKIHIA
jgi:hypothetical protein